MLPRWQDDSMGGKHIGYYLSYSNRYLRLTADTFDISFKKHPDNKQNNKKTELYFS